MIGVHAAVAFKSSVGRGVSSPVPFQAQVLRNHTCGRTCSGADSWLRLYTVMRISVSSGLAFAYSTKTSK